MAGLSADGEKALRELGRLARDLRVKCDEVAVALDSISSGCDEAVSSGDGEVATDIAFDRMQPASSDVARAAEELRRDVRLLDMRLEDVWMSV